jgi:hypothetical protein
MHGPDLHAPALAPALAPSVAPSLASLASRA